MPTVPHAYTDATRPTPLETVRPACRYFTCGEAADYLGGLNARTVARWAREGYIPAIPLGEGKKRLWRFVQVDLDEWMTARRQGGQLVA